MYAIQEISTSKWVSTLSPLVLITYVPNSEQQILEGSEEDMEHAWDSMVNKANYHVIISPKPH